MKTLFLLAPLLIFTNADDDNMVSVAKGQRYCGPILRAKMMFLCESVYKRSSPGSESLHEDWILNFLGADEPLSVYPFRSRAKALAVLPGYFRRHTRGVANECCDKPCTNEEMSNYCGYKPKA